MLKFGSFVLAMLTAFKAVANPACAVCTVAIGASLSLARTLGVDDCVIGVWAGAMLAMVGYWTMRYFDKRDWQFKGRDSLLMGLSVGMIGFMYLGELSYNPMIIGYIFYMDSFLFATLVGAATLIFGMHLYAWMKARNGGHAHFPFEKVVVPVLLVFLVSLSFHYLAVCNCGASDIMEVL